MENTSEEIKDPKALKEPKPEEESKEPASDEDDQNDEEQKDGQKKKKKRNKKKKNAAAPREQDNSQLRHIGSWAPGPWAQTDPPKKQISQ